MKKKDEISVKDSCWNKAGEDEQCFILLGRDAAAPATIRFWAGERIRQGKNKEGNVQLSEALHTANRMESAQVQKQLSITEAVKSLLKDVNDRTAGERGVPEYLLKLRRDLSAALDSMNEKIMGDRTYG